MTEARDCARGCGRGKGPSGRSHAKITWAPDGSVVDAELDEATPIKGTELEQCILDSFRKQRMPPFGGSKPVIIGMVVTVD